MLNVCCLVVCFALLLNDSQAVRILHSRSYTRLNVSLPRSVGLKKCLGKGEWNMTQCPRQNATKFWILCGSFKYYLTVENKSLTIKHFPNIISTSAIFFLSLSPADACLKLSHRINTTTLYISSNSKLSTNSETSCWEIFP